MGQEVQADRTTAQRSQDRNELKSQVSGVGRPVAGVGDEVAAGAESRRASGSVVGAVAFILRVVGAVERFLSSGLT